MLCRLTAEREVWKPDKNLQKVRDSQGFSW